MAPSFGLLSTDPMRLTKRALCFTATLILAISLCGEAEAAKKKKKKKGGRSKPVVKVDPIAWEAITRDGPGGRICFAASEPKAKYPANYQHGAVFFLVSNWKTPGPKLQTSLTTGYALNPEIPPVGTVEAASGKSPKARFFVDGTEAFLERPDDDRSLVAAMRSGSTLKIEAVGADNVRTNYEFSLSGLGASLDAASANCG